MGARGGGRRRRRGREGLGTDALSNVPDADRLQSWGEKLLPAAVVAYVGVDGTHDSKHPTRFVSQVRLHHLLPTLFSFFSASSSLFFFIVSLLLLLLRLCSSSSSSLSFLIKSPWHKIGFEFAGNREFRVEIPCTFSGAVYACLWDPPATWAHHVKMGLPQPVLLLAQN